jgi:hypothetical protein
MSDTTSTSAMAGQALAGTILLLAAPEGRSGARDGEFAGQRSVRMRGRRCFRPVPVRYHAIATDRMHLVEGDELPAPAEPATLQHHAQDLAAAVVEYQVAHGAD